MANRLALNVFLNGEYIGTCELNTHKMIQVGDHNEVRSNTPKEEIKSAITCVCWVRKDDLLATHSFDEFTVKGTYMKQ